MPNPTDVNVADGLAALQSNGWDFIVSFGGGSSHDCAKGVGMATNGGRIHDYEGEHWGRRLVWGRGSHVLACLWAWSSSGAPSAVLRCRPLPPATCHHCS